MTVINKNPKKIVIAGAGCTGLAAAIALLKRGHEVTVIEAEDRVGGLAGGIHIGQNTYEYGPHIFHTTDPEILADVKEIAGKVLLPFEKTIKIKFVGKYFDFPLSMTDVLLKLHIFTVIHAGFSFIWHFIKAKFEGKKSLVNSEKVLQSLYGDVLYRLFFKDYITKVWGIGPSGMAPSFANQRIPRLDILELIAKIKSKFFPNSKASVSTENYVEKVEGENYTTEKGFSLIAECFAERIHTLGGKILLNSKVTSILHTNSKVHTVISTDIQAGNKVELKCDEFISTIPISVLPSLMSPSAPNQLIDSAKNLSFRGIVFIGIVVKRKTVLPASFMYFRDKSFNRITDLAQFKVKIHPSDATILIAEITCQPEDNFWTDENTTKQTVVQELIDEKLISKDEILETHIFKSKYGYPIYKIGYESALSSTLKEISKFSNLHSTGRQGRFAYINTHIAMKMGYECARTIDSKYAK